MIKKILLTFLLAFICFFSIDKVYAMTYQFDPYGMSWHTYSGGYGDGGDNSYIINGKTYYGRELDVTTSQVNFGFRTINFGLVEGYYYDVDFILHYASDGYNELAATFDNNVCEVSSTGQIFATISNSNGVLKTGNGYFYSIHCEDYYAHSGGSDLSVYFPNPVSNITGSTIFAISTDVSVNYGQKQFQIWSKESSDSLNENITDNNEKLNDINNNIKDTNETLNDDDTSESSSEAQEFFEGFTTDTHGLTSIITAPLELIGNIVGSTCSPLPLQIPFVGGTFNLPCMDSIYKKHFGSFLTIYQTITFGIVAYWVCVRIFALVKDFKNPDHDEIEVMDL